MIKILNPSAMTNLNCKSYVLILALFSIRIFGLNATALTSPEFSPITFIDKLSNDTIHKVGELFGGGVIFFVDRTGHHGLICSLSDIKDLESIQKYKNQDPTRFKGRKDSAVLVNQVFAVDNPDHAEEMCKYYTNSNFGTGVFSDWYLPSRDELESIYRARDEVYKALKINNKTKFDPLDKIYWSSSKIYDEVLGTNWLMDFDGGSFLAYSRFRRSPRMYFVRAIRAF